MSIIRQKLTKELLLVHLTDLKKEDDITKVARNAGVSYPTILARFHKAGLSIKKVRRDFAYGAEPQDIVDKVSKRLYNLNSPTRIVRFNKDQSIQTLLNTVLEKLERLEQKEAS